MVALKTMLAGAWSTLFALLPISTMAREDLPPRESWHATFDASVGVPEFELS
jgi:hypothetical protein